MHMNAESDLLKELTQRMNMLTELMNQTAL
jgi:hypothetical protein